MEILYKRSTKIEHLYKLQEFTILYVNSIIESIIIIIS